jgi:UDP-N-acetylglucosamine 2-epimerase (non-hydrolysing)
MKPCIAIVMGTRPEVIKLAPVVARLRAAGWCRVAPIYSGQQAELVRQTLAEFGLAAGDVPSPPACTGDPVELVNRLSDQLRPALSSLKSDFVLVHGDTATALAGARTAVRLGLNVGHVEAGLRTYDLQHPFPEEGHRQAIAKLARVHFAPTPVAAANLAREGIAASAVMMTGNTIVDAMSPRVSTLRETSSATPLAIVTLHRRELAPHLVSVLRGLSMVLQRQQNLFMIVPAHPNPAITVPLRAALGDHHRVSIVAPLPHMRFLDLLQRAAVVITDSGGVQEEAAILGIPLVVVRQVTERPEILDNGLSRVTGFGSQALVDGVSWALSQGRVETRAAGFGDGRASDRIEQGLHLLLRGSVAVA